MAALTEHDLDQLIYDRSVRLLMLRGGRTLWEAAPSPLHQMVIDEIRTSIRPTAQRSDASGCGCYHLSDVYIRLPDESLVRPDIAIFGEQPPRQRQALTLVPAAIIEIISPHYETKDLEELPPSLPCQWHCRHPRHRRRSTSGYPLSEQRHHTLPYPRNHRF